MELGKVRLDLIVLYFDHTTISLLCHGIMKSDFFFPPVWPIQKLSVVLFIENVKTES